MTRFPLHLGLALSACLLAPPVSGQDVLIIDESGLVMYVDPLTGCQTVQYGAANTIQINAMARRNSDDRIFMAGSWSVQVPTLLSLDPNTGNLSTAQLMSGLISVRGLAFDSNDTLWVIDDRGAGQDDELWTFDLVTGTTTLVGVCAGFQGLQSLAWDEQNQRLVAWDVGPGSCVGEGLVHIDPATAATVDADAMFGTMNCDEVQGLGFDAAGTLWAAGDALRKIDPATGEILWTGNCAFTTIQRGVEAIGGSAPSFSLTINGNCPGQVTADIANGTPGGVMGLAWSGGNTGTMVPAGGCAGTLLDLGPNLNIVGAFPLDAQGAASVGPRNVPAGACGNVWLQAIDLGTCDVTNAAQP